MSSRDPLEAQAAQLFHLGDSMMRNFIQVMSREAHKDDLSVNRYNALRTLAERNSCTVTLLAHALQVSAPAVTSMLDKLEHDGHVRRRRNPRDRREVIVAVTAKGRRVCDRIRHQRDSVIRYLLKRMSERDRRGWLRVYEKIDRILSTGAPSAFSKSPRQRPKMRRTG